MPIRSLLPSFLAKPLWGDRRRWGLEPILDDACWHEWQLTYSRFYKENQRKGVGVRVNDAGYDVMRSIDLTGKRVLEIGAGDIRHIRFWRGEPLEYLVADISDDMMELSKVKLQSRGIPFKAIYVARNGVLPLGDSSVDVIVSFYSLEHLHPLSEHLSEFNRILRAGGKFIGAIPSEGGLAWGLGRLVTSRRWLKKHTRIDPDKIICWEHPNYADNVINNLDQTFDRELLEYWPLRSVRAIDTNLIIRFLYKKCSE